MSKNTKIKILLSTVLSGIPLYAGLILWDKLPNLMARHFGANGEPNGFSSKFTVVVIFPLVLMAINLLSMYIVERTNRNNEQNTKALNIIYLICPLVAILSSWITFRYNLGFDGVVSNAKNYGSVSTVVCIFVGLIFILMGNYMPKIKMNGTMGIRTKWTFASEEIWHRTHRLAGKVFVIGGMLTIISATLQNMAVMIVVLILTPLIPVIYSYFDYKKEKEHGRI